MRTAILTAALAGLIAGATAGAPQGAPRTGDPPALPAAGAVPGAGLPIVKSHAYVMAGAVRPILFWMGRDDIGLARIVWRADAAGPRGYELLVGTDPARAPRAINRWGYISEETRGGDGSLLALMTGSHETSYDAEASAASSGAGVGDFRAIRSRTTAGGAAWQLDRVRTPAPLTVHQVTDALEYLRRYGGRSQQFTRTLAPNVRPGFLVAVAELLDDTLARSAHPAAPTQGTVRYTFGSRTYELRVRDTRPTRVTRGGSTVPALRIRFETRTLDSGDTTRFEVTSATGGALSGVPLLIEWQPRWWLRVSLRLADPL